MIEFYFITRLCTLHEMCHTIAITFGVLIMAFVCVAGISSFCEDFEEKTEQRIKNYFCKLLCVEAVALLVFAITPSTKDALIIYGIGGTVDYIKNNPTASKLPDKFVIYLDKLIDEELKDDKEEE